MMDKLLKGQIKKTIACLYKCIYINICNINDKGTISINFSFLILCLDSIIPIRVPRLPPKIVIVNKWNSLILYFFFIARSLSMNIKTKASIFIQIK